MKTKFCKNCGKEKSIKEFYRHSNTKDGYFNICKECVIKRAKNYRKENIEKVREYDRNRPNKEERYVKNKEYVKNNRKRVNEAKLNWKKRNKDKVNAYVKVKRAIEKGILKKPIKCELCGEKTELYAHHTDYSQPLKVIFLCDKCHKIEHKKINEKMRKIENGKICSC